MTEDLKLSKLSRPQRRMLINALHHDRGLHGYAPCGHGFPSTMESLVRLGFAIAHRTVLGSIRGISLTERGRTAAEFLNPGRLSLTD